MTVGGTFATAGLLALAGQVNGSDSTTFRYFAFDGSDAEESASHTGPQSEITVGLSRIEAICSTEAPDRTVLTATITPTAEVTIKAICIMSAATGGTMLIRKKLTSPITMAPATNRILTWKIGNAQEAA
jgi:hypothetical protein